MYGSRKAVVESWERIVDDIVAYLEIEELRKNGVTEYEIICYIISWFDDGE